MSALWLSARYVLLEERVREASRRVWHAEDRLLGRPVLIKGMLEESTPAMGTESGEGSGGSRHALLEEYQRLLRHRHPRIPPALDFEFAPSAPGEEKSLSLTYFTQEWVEGPSLRGLFGRLTLDEIEACLLETLEILAFLHDQGLVCLDLKPDHLLRSEAGWRLIDLDQARAEQPLAGAAIHGTRSYLSPEVLMGGVGSISSDLYSLGVTILEALVGELPVDRGDTLAAIGKYRLGNPLSKAVPESVFGERPRLAKTIVALLANEVSGRPADAEEAMELLSGRSSSTWRTRCALPETRALGAEEALRRLESIISDARKERGGAALIVGPVGSGRRRLAGQLASSWALEGASSLRLDPTELPAKPLILPSLMLAFLSTFTRHAMGELPHPPKRTEKDTPEATRQAVICWYLTQLSKSMEAASRARQAPIHVLIQNVDRADPMSLLVLESLVHYLSGSGIVLLLTGTQALAKRMPGVACLHMKPLEGMQLRAIVEELIGPALLRSEEALESLHRRSEGWPGPLREALLPLWRDPLGAKLDRSLPLWRDPLGAKLDRSSEGHAALLDLERSLAPEAFGQLRFASLIPDSMELGEWAAAAGVRPKRLEIAHLESMGLLTRLNRLEGAKPRWRFSSPTIQRALAGALEKEERLEGHQRIIRYLQGLAFEQEIPAARLAHHFLHVDSIEGAVAAVQAALKESEDSGQLESAVSFTTLLLEKVPEGSRAEAHLRLKLGRLFKQLRDSASAEIAWRRALEATLENEQRREALAGLGDALLSQRKLEEARTALSEAVQSDVRERELPTCAATPLQQLAFIEISRGELRNARRWSDMAARVIPHRDQRLCAEQHYVEALLAQKGGEGETAMHSLCQGLRCAERAGSSGARVKLLNLKAKIHQDRGEYEVAIDDIEEVLKLASELYARAWEADASRNEGDIFARLGRGDEALAAYERSAKAASQLGYWSAALTAWLNSAELLLKSGKPEGAEGRLARARNLLPKGGDEGQSARWRELHERIEAMREGGRSGLEVGKPSRERTIIVEEGRFILDAMQRLLEPTHNEEELAKGLAALSGRLIGGKGLVFLFDGDLPTVIGGEKLERAQMDDISSRIVRQVRDRKIACIYPDILAVKTNGLFSSLRSARVRSINCQPILVNDTCVGTVYVHHPEPEGATCPPADDLVRKVTALAARLLKPHDASRFTVPEENKFGIVSVSPAMVKLCQQLENLLGEKELPRIVLFGETGVGKNYLAERIHKARGGDPNRFIEVSCPNIEPTAFEALMFGATHLTMNTAPIVGYFERAEGGTLFLDELQYLSQLNQQKLLSPLNQPHGSFTPVGSKTSRAVSCNIICGTSQYLPYLETEGLFLQELAGRVCQSELEIPSLRERGPEDIVLLSRKFLGERLAVADWRHLPLEDYLTPPAITFLTEYTWPKNVRQLMHLFRRNLDIGAILRSAGSGVRVQASDLRQALKKDLTDLRVKVGARRQPEGMPPAGLTWKELREFQDMQGAEYAQTVLKNHGNRKSKAAAALEISRATLDRILKRCGERGR